jgi:hypothetical protein
MPAVQHWGDGAGHPYGQVTNYDPPRRLATGGALMPGVILDSSDVLEADGDETALKAPKVIVGPLSEEQAEGIRRYGDLGPFEGARRRLVEGSADDEQP